MKKIAVNACLFAILLPGLSAFLMGLCTSFLIVFFEFDLIFVNILIMTAACTFILLNAIPLIHSNKFLSSLCWYLPTLLYFLYVIYIGDHYTILAFLFINWPYLIGLLLSFLSFNKNKAQLKFETD